jgi:two-component system sensor histidine kinase DesK
MPGHSILLSLANVGDRRQSTVATFAWAAAFELPLLAIAYQGHPDVLAVGLLVLFAVAHAINASSIHLGRLSDGRRAVLCGVMSALALAAVLQVGPDWSLLLPFLSAAMAVALPGRLLPVVLIWPAVLAGGLSVLVPGVRFGTLVVECTVVALGMASFRRMLELVAELYRSRDRMARLAVVEERLRIARDLHDLLGHTLLSIVLKAELIRKLGPPGEINDEARNIEQIGRLAIERVRAAVTEFRLISLSTAIAEAVSALRDAGIHAVVSDRGTPFPEQVETVLGWVIREGVTNVVRHSGARECQITVYRTESDAVVELRDDGEGTSADVNGGHGLRGLWERLAKVGGELDAKPDAAGGFRLTALVPLRAAP